MKKFRDISGGDERGDVDIVWDDFVEYVCGAEEWDDIHRDIETEWRNDIQVWKKREIHLEKKKGMKFDALEKESFLTSFLKKDIVIHGEEKRFFSERIPKYTNISTHVTSPLTQLVQSLSTYFQNLGKKGIVTLGSILFFVVISVIYLDKIFVENRVNAGYEKLLEVREWSISLEQIQKNINNSRFDLLLADTFFTPFKIIPWEKINTAQFVIAGGRHLTRALDDVLWLYDTVNDFAQEKWLWDIYFTQLFENIAPELQDIEMSLEKSLQNYKAISWLPSQELEQQRQGNIIKIEKILTRVQALNNKFPEFLNLLGHEKRKRYLIVFQNADEIRPTWGFMWSMWLLEIFKWKVQLFQKKDVYAIEWDLKTAEYERLNAPKWISELTDTFGLRDANYYVNLKDSSEAIKFFTDSAGIDIDGIVYINQNTLLHFLEVTGPVYFPALDMYITHDNFSETMSLVVEAKIFQAGTLGTPKQVLFDFMEIFTAELIAQWKYFDYLQTLVHDVESRDIMMWSFAPDENMLLTDISLNGKIDYDTSLDFTYPSFTSLSGNKSDRYMQRSYTQNVVSGENCSFDVNFEIQSQHAMSRQDIDSVQSIIQIYELDSPNLLEIQWAAKNRQFVRVILPSEAQITLRDDFEIVDYGSRRGIEFFLDTELSQTSFYEFQYTLPNPECRSYDYTLYKQPGIPEFDVLISIDGENYNYQDRQEDFYFEVRD